MSSDYYCDSLDVVHIVIMSCIMNICWNNFDDWVESTNPNSSLYWYFNVQSWHAYLSSLLNNVSESTTLESKGEVWLHNSCQKRLKLWCSVQGERLIARVLRLGWSQTWDHKFTKSLTGSKIPIIIQIKWRSFSIEGYNYVVTQLHLMCKKQFNVM